MLEEPAGGVKVLAHPMGTARSQCLLSCSSETGQCKALAKDALLSVNSIRENLKIPKEAVSEFWSVRRTDYYVVLQAAIFSE